MRKFRDNNRPTFESASCFQRVNFKPRRYFRLGWLGGAPGASIRLPRTRTYRGCIRLVADCATIPQDIVGAVQGAQELTGIVDNSVGELWGICEIKLNLCTRNS
jgi:hypothetical protein